MITSPLFSNYFNRTAAIWKSFMLRRSAWHGDQETSGSKTFVLEGNLNRELDSFHYLKSIGFAKPKEAALLDDFCNSFGNHRFPGNIVILNSPEHVARENGQDAFVEVVELL